MKEQILVLILITILASHSFEVLSFDQFIAKFQKAYRPGSQEYNLKKQIFQFNVEKLKQKNCSACGITKFFDVSSKEFEERMLNLKMVDTPVSSPLPVEVQKIKLSAPRSIDWRSRGIITSVKNQGDCGCCWSFATIALAESNLIMKGLADQSIDLSEQYLLKCTPEGSCKGGYIQNAIKYITNYGAPPESKYPYNPFKETVQCSILGTGNVKVATKKPQSYYDLSDQKIKTLLSEGPLAIAIDSTDWQFYSGGVWKCQTGSDVNHAVLLVGYTEDGKSWIIKNQWGKDWGENGYIYVSTDRRYNCRIGTAVHRLSQPYHSKILLLIILFLFGFLY